MSGFGLLFAGPLQGHYWFQYLDKVSLLASQTSSEGVYGLFSDQSTVFHQSKQEHCNESTVFHPAYCL